MLTLLNRNGFLSQEPDASTHSFINNSSKQRLNSFSSPKHSASQPGSTAHINSVPLHSESSHSPLQTSDITTQSHNSPIHTNRIPINQCPLHSIMQMSHPPPLHAHNVSLHHNSPHHSPLRSNHSHYSLGNHSPFHTNNEVVSNSGLLTTTHAPALPSVNSPLPSVNSAVLHSNYSTPTSSPVRCAGSPLRSEESPSRTTGYFILSFSLSLSALAIWNISMWECGLISGLWCHYCTQGGLDPIQE